MSPRGGPSYKQLRPVVGVTVTFEHRLTGALRTTVTPGSGVREALVEALVAVDPDLWRVLTISTPQTIYDDLIRRRKQAQPGERNFGKRPESPTIDAARTPERFLLGALQGGLAYL